MAKKYSYEQIATDFELWGEYVDPDAGITKAQFYALSVDEKIQMQNEMFGEDGYDQSDF